MIDSKHLMSQLNKVERLKIYSQYHGNLAYAFHREFWKKYSCSIMIDRTYIESQLRSKKLRSNRDYLWGYLIFEERYEISPNKFFTYQIYKKETGVGRNQLGHYLKVGFSLKPKLAEIFDSVVYLEMNPDIEESGINPLLHYLKYGLAEQRIAFNCFCKDNALLSTNAMFNLYPLHDCKSQIPIILQTSDKKLIHKKGRIYVNEGGFHFNISEIKPENETKLDLSHFSKRNHSIKKFDARKELVINSNSRVLVLDLRDKIDIGKKFVKDIEKVFVMNSLKFILTFVLTNRKSKFMDLEEHFKPFLIENLGELKLDEVASYITLSKLRFLVLRKYSGRLALGNEKNGVYRIGQPFLPGVSHILPSTRPERLLDQMKSFRRSTYAKSQFIIGLHGDRFSSNFKNNLKKYLDSNNFNYLIQDFDKNCPLGTMLNELAYKCDGEVIAKIDDDDIYSKYYTESLVYDMINLEADFVGKYMENVRYGNHSLFSDSALSEIFCTSDRMTGSSLFFKREILNHVQFLPVKLGEDFNFRKRSLQTGVNMKLTSGWGHIVNRGQNINHTWQIDEYEFEGNVYKNSVFSKLNRAEIHDLILNLDDLNE